MKRIIVDFVRKNMAWVILIFLMIVFCFSSPHFFSYNNIITILQQSSYLVVAAIGLAFIMMSGEMDISVGYTISAANVILGKLIIDMGLPEWLAIFSCIVFCVLVSLFNSAVARLLQMQLMVVSIGTMTILQGLTYIISGSKSISGFSDGFKFIGQGRVLNFPISVAVAILVIVVFSFILDRTYFGRYVYAVGGNEVSAQLAGINIKKVRLLVSVICGLCVGIGTVLLVTRLGNAQSSVGPGTEFTIITGVCLGGVSIRGGEGKLSGVVAGILCLQLLSNGMQLASMNTYYQYIIKGVIMLVAIGFDVYEYRRRMIELMKEKAK